MMRAVLLASSLAAMFSAGAAQGSAESYEIFRTDCTGKATFMEHSPYEAAIEMSFVARGLEQLHQMINTRGAATCPAWSEQGFGE